MDRPRCSDGMYSNHTSLTRTGSPIALSVETDVR